MFRNPISRQHAEFSSPFHRLLSSGLAAQGRNHEPKENQKLFDYPLLIESVERIQSNKTLVKLTLRGSHNESKFVEVLFGRRRRAHIVEQTPLAIICEVPKSEYDGIGYLTKVRIHVHVEDDSGRYDVPFTNTSDAWWVYTPTTPATRVANVATTLFYKNNDHLLVKVFHLFAARLDRDWRFQFIVYNGVPHFFLNDPLVQEEMENGRLEIFERPPLTYKECARAQLQPEYWEQMHGDRVLVFQADSVPCSGTIYKISDFYNYTYVGAPWCYLNLSGGNSGLSLRNKTAIIDLLKTHKDRVDRALSDPSFLWEDILFGLFSLTWQSSNQYLFFHFLFMAQLKLELITISALHQRMLAFISVSRPSSVQNHGEFIMHGVSSMAKTGGSC